MGWGELQEQQSFSAELSVITVNILFIHLQQNVLFSILSMLSYNIAYYLVSSNYQSFGFRSKHTVVWLSGSLVVSLLLLFSLSLFWDR